MIWCIFDVNKDLKLNPNLVSNHIFYIRDEKYIPSSTIAHAAVIPMENILHKKIFLTFVSSKNIRFNPFHVIDIFKDTSAAFK